MKCIHCQGNMKWGTTPFHIDRKGCRALLAYTSVYEKLAYG